MADATKLFQSLKAKSKFEVVDHTLEANKLRVIGRIRDDQSGQSMQNWLIIARNLLLAQEKGAPWKVDISKQYFLKGPDDSKKIVYGHRLIIQATDIANHFDDIVRVVLGSKPAATVEMSAFPLPGASPDRNVGRNGKGANSIGGR